MKKNEYVFGENSIINKAAGILSCYKEGDALIKAYNDDIAKAEGARGGKVIGHTKSGKPIYESANHESHKNFSIAEHDDAINAHQKVRDDYHKNNNSTDEDKKANDHAFEQQKKHIGAKNHMMRDMTPAEARAAAAESEKNNVEKSEDDNISKGSGEGSRGGKVIGHTKSGKPIYANTSYNPKQDTYKNFSKEDHEEAASLHQAEAIKYKDKNETKHKDSLIYANSHINASKEKEPKDSKEAKEKKIETAEDGSHSVEHKGSKYHSKPDESKEDFKERAKKAIKEDHKDDVEFKKSEETSDLQKAYEILGLGDLIQKGGVGSGRKIGQTASGKHIFTSSFDKPHGDFSNQDHLDAERIHRKEADKYKGNKTSEDRAMYKHHAEQAQKHSDAANTVKKD